MIRKATIDDAWRIAEIHVMGWRSAYSDFLDENYLYTKMRVDKRIAAFRTAIESGQENTWIDEEGGLILGFSTIGKCRDEDRPEAFELWGIYVDPFLQGRGAGRRLVAHCDDWARAGGYGEILLWVFEKNVRARSFYERMGFEPEGRRQEIEYFKAIEVRYRKALDPA